MFARRVRRALRRPVPGALAILLSVLPAALPAFALPPGSTPRELELGEEAARDIARAVEFVEDPETLAKLQAMLDEIAAATDRPQIRYTPHIVLTPAVNAFVIPGGWVYVTTGLLDSVASDDELAGVLAHEIAHNVNQHAIERMRNAPKGLGLLQVASLAALAAMILGAPPELGVLTTTAANTITAMVLQGGSIAAEVEADADGIEYLSRTHFHPAGAVTFHERMAGAAGRLYEKDMGIYRTHPFSRDRVLSARAKLKELGVPLLRRLVTDPPQPQARQLVVQDRPVTEITYDGTRLLLLAGHDPERTGKALASIRYAMDYEVGADSIKIVPAEDGVIFVPGEGPRFFFSRADGEANGEGEVLLAGDLRDELAAILAAERQRIVANTALY